MIITPSQIESQYTEIPYGSPQGDYGWVIGKNPAYAQHGVYGTPPSYFKVMMPAGRVKRFSMNIMGSSNQTGLACLSYGSLPGPFESDGPYVRHNTVLIEKLKDTLFQWTTNGQVIHQVYSSPIVGGKYLYCVLYGTPYAVQVDMQMAPAVVTPPVDPIEDVVQKCTLKDATTKFVIKHPVGVTLELKQEDIGNRTVFIVRRK